MRWVNQTYKGILLTTLLLVIALIVLLPPVTANRCMQIAETNQTIQRGGFGGTHRGAILAGFNVSMRNTTDVFIWRSDCKDPYGKFVHTSTEQCLFDIFESSHLYPTDKLKKINFGFPKNSEI